MKKNSEIFVNINSKMLSLKLHTAIKVAIIAGRIHMSVNHQIKHFIVKVIIKRIFILSSVIYIKLTVSDG